jgi:NitT/TauT family transport system ATP-binding protein
MRLVVEGVWHAFGATAVLDDISLTVDASEVVVVIGPSGCGKSTLLSIVGGLLQPVAGTVAIEGAPPKESLNPITFVFQDFALLPWRSVRDNVAFALEHHALSRAERDRLVHDALARTGLSDFAGALPKQLSGGMRQRVGIARALAVSPAVCLMDEPLSALDAQTREILLEDFRLIWERERVATVYITHNLDEALRLADRVVVLSRRPGRIKDVIAVPIPRPERTSEAAAPELARLHNRLWRLIRDEAIAADRELALH